MTDAMFYWLGSAVALFGGLIVAALLVAFAGWLLLRAAVYMLANGLHVIRLQNWRYWNDRMQKEGLIVMQKFYQEQVKIHKPKSLQDFDELDRAATKNEQSNPEETR